MRRVFPAALLLVLACSSTPLQRDRAAISRLIFEEGERQREAWDKRDASLMFPPGQTDHVMNDVQRRMNMTVSIEEMSLRIGEIVVNGDEAVGLSYQKFARTMALPGARPRLRISTVTHRHQFRRNAAGTWEAYGGIAEIDPKAWWDGEAHAP